ncbi:MAG: threonylcarbamoyl-AMP synthase [Clostridia bacterium]|nr:threonylcarbamoyl-AMP synthase [Clostridia bacterium]
MITKRMSLDPEAVSVRDLDEAGRILREGGLVVFPTETVYGLGGNALDASASQKIYAAKGRPSDNPLIVHIAKPEDAERFAIVSDAYRVLASAFMPGPLTVILPKKDIVPVQTTGGLSSVAIRCPSHPVAHALIEASGVPIAAPSANLSGKPSPTCADDVAEDMDGRVDLILDGGPSEIGLESTIVSLLGPVPTLLRPGAVTYDALCCVLPRVEIAPAVTGQLSPDEPVLSPGLKYRHYSPNAPCVLLDGNADEVLRFLIRAQSGSNCAILCYDEEIPALTDQRLFPVGKREDLSAQAHMLFAQLRAADRSGADVIYAHLPPREGLGLALYNRMIRAAAHTVKHIENPQ